MILKIITGTPNGNLMKYFILDGIAYLLIIKGDKETTDIYVFIRNLSDIDLPIILDPKIKKIIRTHTIIENVIEYEEAIDYLTEFEGLDGLIYTTLTNVPMIILGEETEIRKFTFSCNYITDIDLAKNIQFATTCSEIDTTYNWIGLEAKEENLELIKPFMNKFVVVSLPKKRIINPFSSTIANELAELIRTKNINDYYAACNILFKSFEEIKDKDLSEIADILGINIDDAEFFYNTHQIFRQVKDHNHYEFRRLNI